MWVKKREASKGDWMGSASEACFAIFAVSVEKQWKRMCVMGLEGRGDVKWR